MKLINKAPLSGVIKVTLVAVCCSIPTFAVAADSPIDVGLRLSSLGPSIEVAKPFNEKWSARLTYGSFNTAASTSTNDMDFNAKLAFQHFGAIADYHPFGGGLRLSVGAYNNNQTLDLTVKAKAGNFTFNGNTYALADVGSAEAKIDFGSSLAPYLGLGWSSGSNNTGGLAFAVDAGVLINGAPTASFAVTCGSTLTAAECNTLTADIKAEEASLTDSVKVLKAYPVLSMGLNYRF